MFQLDFRKPLSAARRVRRNIANVRQRRRPVFQIIGGDEGSFADFPCPQPPGADFKAQLRGADARSLRGFRNAVGNWRRRPVGFGVGDWR